MNNKKAGLSFTDKISIVVKTRIIIPFDDFLKNESTEKLQVMMPSDSSKVADFAFRGVFIDFKGSQKSEISLTLKHLLYLYYHHIFNINTYSIIENYGSELEKCYLVNEYERIAMNYPLPKTRKTNNKKGFACSVIGKNAKMFPIRIWQEDEDSLNDLKKVLNKFTPNSEYDQKEENISSDFSIRSSEIFEYFTSTSKYQKIDNIENTRKVLIKEGIIENIPDEILQKQIEFISNFLSNILK